MANCRGYYLSLASPKTLSDSVEKHTCFLVRNSLLLKALSPMSQKDEEICNKYNVKGKMLKKLPEWMMKWIANILRQIDLEAEEYKK